MRTLYWLVSVLLLASVAGASANPEAKSGYFTTSDGVRLHYPEAGHVIFADETDRFNAILEDFVEDCFPRRSTPR